MPDIKQINVCIARNYCNVIHSRLVGQVQQGPNSHIFYVNTVEEYIRRQHKSPEILMSNVKSTTKLYCDITRDIITQEMLVEEFVLNYTFIPVYEKLTYLQKIEIYNSIIYKTLIAYIEWLHSQDERMFYGIELTEEQKISMRNKLVELIKLNGAIERYTIYNSDNEVVPRKLFMVLKNQYDELKRQLEESAE
jgi:hypothetical protein